MRTLEQRRAIAWWCEMHNLRPELSSHPTYRFTNKVTGEITERNIINLVAEYKRFKEEKGRRKKGA